MKRWKLKRVIQCDKCPWRTDVNPHEIPNGYCEIKHRNLDSTIAKDGDLSQLFSQELKIMACHETHDAHCIGWLCNQAGVGNNISLRISLSSCINFKNVKIKGDQHENFLDTLPL